MPELAAIAPIIWAKWGAAFLEALRQEALGADDRLAFRAMNSDAGIRKLLTVCTTSREQIRNVETAISLNPVPRSVRWESYSVAEMIFKTEKGGGLGCQALWDGSNRICLILCATRPASVQTIERLFDLPE